VLVFGELHGLSATTYAQVIGGSLLMILGVAAILAFERLSERVLSGVPPRSAKSDRYGSRPTSSKLAWMVASPWAKPLPRAALRLALRRASHRRFICLGTIARVPDIPAHWILQSFSPSFL